MAKIYNPPKHRAGMRATGTLIGIGVSALLFLAIPLTQIFTQYEKVPEEIEAIDIAIDKLDRQLARSKERRKHHKGTQGTTPSEFDELS